ncbi:protein of unknown function [Pararobbsia alpina]
MYRKAAKTTLKGKFRTFCLNTPTPERERSPFPTPAAPSGPKKQHSGSRCVATLAVSRLPPGPDYTSCHQVACCLAICRGRTSAATLRQANRCPRAGLRRMSSIRPRPPCTIERSLEPPCSP